MGGFNLNSSIGEDFLKNQYGPMVLDLVPVIDFRVFRLRF